MKNRILFLDFFRGIAILQMIFWQIFDFFAKPDIYIDAPFYISLFNMPIHGIVVGLFAFISGFSVYLSIKNKKEKEKKRPEIIKHIFKRYGVYILLSLLLTIIVFDINMFFGWNEAVQGIALSALVLGFLLMFSRSVYPAFIIAVLIILFQKLLREIIANNLGNAWNFILNPLFNGFFSLSHLLPAAIFGALMASLYFKSKKKQFVKSSLLIGLPLLIFSIVAHILDFKIDYYNRSFSYLIFLVGFSTLILLVIYLIIKNNLICRIISLFGQTALFVYLAHFLLIFKPLEIMGLNNTFAINISLLISVIAVILLYYLSIAWLKLKKIISIKIIF